MTDLNFDSKFEQKLYSILDPSEVNYHPEDCRLAYTLHKNYEPDWVIWHDAGYVTYIEAKGRFRDRIEASKYLAVRSGLGPKEELVFILQNPKANMPGAARRKDGTRASIGEWCDRHDFKWFTADTLPQGWRRKL